MNSPLDVASSVLLALDSGKDDFFTTYRRFTNENDNQLRSRRWSTFLLQFQFIRAAVSSQLGIKIQ
ncbi:hypothetical protein ACUDTJ_14040 [Stenotrophomonas pavanii]|uniref:hypothetical protein n=1 Tax=Stenotrophomonas pavanii TaxID=487698 RepID=UPI0006BFD8A0|nr:hypothetical protein [Stenotrophomonas pavanii]KAA3599967.1 hypothetical protein D1178_13625 [Stenotrophomonas maltophilia]KOO80036.1 hypothetical protein VO93_16290 [Stenotrophomonas maltophilia]KRG79038.1 hypothetical protein ABB31_14055 [Stenotrophomonas pavanii]SDJ91624.1 hypothetical protein SAMN04487784_0651 [Stenotrophomonas pavanii]